MGGHEHYDDLHVEFLPPRAFPSSTSRKEVLQPFEIRSLGNSYGYAIGVASNSETHGNFPRDYCVVFEFTATKERNSSVVVEDRSL